MNHSVSPPWRRDLPIYTGLALTTTCYALVLDRARRLIEPDWVWAEVVFGTTLCLAATELCMHGTRAPTAADYRRATWTSFAVGGAPIILWQFWQMSQRYQRAIAEWKKDIHADSTLPLA